ncbi:MAG: sporulation protein YunB [Acutalibacteraceae bacterium]|nr:sporulation protein YunB [Acutalibacteraceae bacterium]
MRKRYRKHRFPRVILIFFLIAVIIIMSVTYYLMQPIILKYAVSVAETIALNAANEAIVDVLNSNQVSYGDIVTLSQNDEGYVTSLEINVLQINNLKSEISRRMAKIIEEEERYELRIPLGSFFGNSYTNGIGPDIKFNMQITTTCFVDFSHEFKSAGINQVLHIVNVNIDVKGNFVIIGYNKGISASTGAIAAQTVIVGKTPDAFTSVIESPTDNTGGLINDYGATIE